MKIFIRFYIWLSVLVAILLLISFPLPEYNGTIETYYDKVVHLIMFGGFAGISFWYLSVYKRISFEFTLILSGILSIMYAGAGEIIQSYVPGRTVSELDFAAGFFGAVLAVITIYVWKRKKI